MANHPFEFDPDTGERVRPKEPGSENETSPSPPAGRVIKKTEFVGTGFWIQLAGIVLLFFYPIGTFVGVVLIIAGQFQYTKYRCSACHNPVDNRQVSVCPACHERLGD